MVIDIVVLKMFLLVDSTPSRINLPLLFTSNAHGLKAHGISWSHVPKAEIERKYTNNFISPSKSTDEKEKENSTIKQ